MANYDSNDTEAGLVVNFLFLILAAIVIGIFFLVSKCSPAKEHKPDKVERTLDVLDSKWEKWLDKNESK